jgi:phage terminase large subunit-like protein
MTKEQKTKAMAMLGEAYDQQWPELNSIEPRLRDYIYDVATFETAHNGYEVLGAVKFLRLLRTYDTDIETFRDVIYKYEGRWEKTSDGWHHMEGGLRHPGTTGPMHYRLQPFQVFVLASMFLLKAWINTESEIGSRGIGPTEQPMPDGMIYDHRRLCTEFTLYTPRKTAKTQLSAFIQFYYFMSGDENAECYCCANAADQAKILFTRTSQLIHQMDTRERRIRFTASQVNWKPGQFRSASLTALSAGGKTKDGLFAQLCSADEYGSAAYVNGASDMGKLVSVVESSMGPRREPMTFISTTAGIIQAGPFIDKLAGIKALLMHELEPDYHHELSTDRQACLLLEPDEWEQQDEELLLTDRSIRRKVNPMLGVIVQHSFYDDEIAKARQNPEKMNEVISKLLNVYHMGRVKTWAVTADKVRRLQEPRRVTDCLYRDGWNVFVGMDFSSGEDLFALTYLCVNYSPGLEMQQRFFADTQVWIVESELKRSPNRPLYERWIADGWMRVCPGDVFDPDLAINEMMAMSDAGVNLYGFGYDPAQSRQPINTLKAWLQSIFKKANPNLKASEIADMINDMVTPVSQNFMTMNPAIGELEHYILTPWLHFSQSPLWPWQVGNVRVETSRDETLRKLMKSGANNKVDSIHALLDAIVIFDLSEGKLKK